MGKCRPVHLTVVITGQLLRDGIEEQDFSKSPPSQTGCGGGVAVKGYSMIMLWRFTFLSVTR